MKKLITVIFFVLTSFVLLSQKEKGYTSFLYGGMGIEFRGQDNYTSIIVGHDNVFPNYYDYKFYGYAFHLSIFSKNNFLMGGSVYFKPLKTYVLRNPYIFFTLNLQGGLIRNLGKYGAYARPEINFLLNGKAFKGANFRFRFGLGYDVTTIQEMTFKHPVFSIYAILGRNKEINMREF